MEVWLLNAAHMKAVPGPQDRRAGRGVDRAAARARAAAAVVRAAAADPPAAAADPLPGAAAGRPDPGDDPAGADARGRLDQAVRGGVEPDHGLGAGDAGRDDRRRARPAGAGASMAKGKMRGKIPELTEALTGHFDDAPRPAGPLDPAPAASWSRPALAELDAVIAAACAPWAHQIELLQTIPGVGAKVAQVIIAETGGGHVPVPVRGAPGRVGRARAGDLRVRRQAHPGRRPAREQVARPRCWSRPPARSAACTARTTWPSQHARLTKRRGMGRAQVAVAHSILVSAY